jgi:hypothetical protein
VDRPAWSRGIVFVRAREPAWRHRASDAHIALSLAVLWLLNGAACREPFSDSVPYKHGSFLADSLTQIDWEKARGPEAPDMR